MIGGESWITNQPKLLTFVDAAYTNDQYKRQYITGLTFTFCGGAIAYRFKTQYITVISYNEAEFPAVVYV